MSRHWHFNTLYRCENKERSLSKLHYQDETKAVTLNRYLTNRYNRSLGKEELNFMSDFSYHKRDIAKGASLTDIDEAKLCFGFSPRFVKFSKEFKALRFSMFSGGRERVHWGRMG